MYPALTRTIQYTISNYELLQKLKNNSVNWYQAEYEGYRLPATEEAHSWCGDWSYLGCLNVDGHAGTEAQGKAFIKTFQKHCFRSSCEECASNWMSRESNKSASRLEVYEKKTGEKAKHIILSPGENFKNKSIPELRKEAYKILKFVKAKGGCLVVHPFRNYKTYDFQNGKTNSDFWYPAVHFHIVGFGWLENIVENYKKNGWVVKNKGTRESNFGTIRYILSHAGIKKKSHTLTWFGDLSYSKLKVPEFVNEERICPYCSEELGEVSPIEALGCKPPSQELECLVNVEEWFRPYYTEFK